MQNEEHFKSGFMTLVGRPNAGKSTLLNALIGQKVAITSNTPQTTRHRFRGILNGDGFQLVIVDTPGIHKPHDALGDALDESAFEALQDVDIIAFVLDSTAQFGTGDKWVLDSIGKSKAAKLLVVSKTDMATADVVEAQMNTAESAYGFDAAIALSAVSGEGLGELVETATTYLPEGPLWFPKDVTTDQPLEVIVAEFIREKILRLTFDEVPHAVGVQVDELEYAPRKKKGELYRIFATVYVETDSQKGIIVGKGGSLIKSIGIAAREDLEHMLGCKVFLDLHVKVRKNWRRDANQIRRFGYGA
ncbi:MAG: GTPase Era [Coriobacteriales bacterium]|jgi:GTP-binding protein Era|nr:GTPase Era [Coriobacteriales bacterium]